MSFPPAPPLPWMQTRFGLIPLFNHNFDKGLNEPGLLLFILPFLKKDEQLLKNQWQGNNLK